MQMITDKNKFLSYANLQVYTAVYKELFHLRRLSNKLSIILHILIFCGYCL